MKERDLQTTILQAASLFGWRAYHTFDSRRSAYGFPDLVIAGHGKLIMWELKAKLGSLTHHQADWMGTLSEVQSPPIVEVVRPEDLDRCLDLLHRRGKL